MAPPQASEPRALAPKKEKAAWLGGLTESCRSSRITLPCDLHTDGATAGTSGNASRGHRDSWRTISSLADGMERTVLGKSLSKSGVDDQKGVSESGNSSVNSLLTANTTWGWWGLFWFVYLFYKSPPAPFKWKLIPQSWYKPQGKPPRWQRWIHEGNSIRERPQE